MEGSLRTVGMRFKGSFLTTVAPFSTCTVVTSKRPIKPAEEAVYRVSATWSESLLQSFTNYRMPYRKKNMSRGGCEMAKTLCLYFMYKRLDQILPYVKRSVPQEFYPHHNCVLFWRHNIKVRITINIFMYTITHMLILHNSLVNWFYLQCIGRWNSVLTLRQYCRWCQKQWLPDFNDTAVIKKTYRKLAENLSLLLLTLVRKIRHSSWGFEKKTKWRKSRRGETSYKKSFSVCREGYFLLPFNE
jgi:hypothetical protein